MIRCSVCILTYNSEKTIKRCLDSVKDFYDLVVFDGGSADKTAEIAAMCGARVFPQNDNGGKIEDFTEVRKRLFSAAKEDWVLWLDSDEWLDEAAVKNIERVILENNKDVLYAFVRKAVIGERKIERAYFYPEYCKRLFNKNSDVSLKKGKKVHEDLVPGENSTVEKIFGVILHEWSEKYAELLKKDNHYLNLTVLGKEALSKKKLLRIACTNVLKAAKVFLKSFFIYARFGFRETLPIAFSWRFVRYHLIYAKKILWMCK